jgi:2-dehydro-3-deoxyphosphogluconate aldolase/(4S)-4-hydroxy-2-oxoglutarate aldolase
MDVAINHIKQDGLIAIVRGEFTVAQVLAIGETLAAAAITVLEITLNTRDALTAIEQLRGRFANTLLIGAGTVRTAAQWHDARNAGAQFTVAPNLDMGTVAAAHQYNFLHLPGVFTPTEAETAFRAGCQVVKLFPCDAMGPKYLKALRAPLDDIAFVPTGGITTDNIAAYRRAGALACGIGSALVTHPGQPLDELRQRGEALRRAWDGNHE